MTGDKEFCYRCNCETEWKPAGRNGDYLKCVGCGDRFPCAKSRKCGHLDCKQEHEFWE